MYPSDLQCSRDAGRNESCRHQILRLGWIEVKRAACDGKRRGDNGSDHGQGMLKSEDKREQNWDAIIKPVERCFVILVLLVERPDVGCEKVYIVLDER